MTTHDAPQDSSSWIRHDWVGSAQEFHALELASERAVWLCSVTEPAIILGSTQPSSDINEATAAKLGLSIAQRRSGGGAVYVHSTDSVWIDVTIPRDDPLWVDDISQSMLWLGDAFSRALTPWTSAHTYRDPFSAGADGRSVCFASTSPGEVFVGAHKLVGISQRRGRNGARLQCVLYRQWNPVQWVPALQSPEVQDRVMAMTVATVEASAGQIADALMAQL